MAMLELLPSVDNLLNVHGEDFAEIAFQRKLRAEQNMKSGRRMLQVDKNLKKTLLFSFFYFNSFPFTCITQSCSLFLRVH